jgi:tetratricopeptide (TPR) repeat protein
MHILWVGNVSQNAEALETVTQLSALLTQEVTLTCVAYHDEEGLLPFYLQAQKLAVGFPCLLLFEGESISNFDPLKNHLDGEFQQLIYAQIHHPEHIELSPRLFPHDNFKLKGCRFVTEYTSPGEHIPLVFSASSKCVYTTQFAPDLSRVGSADELPDLYFWLAYRHFKAMEDEKAIAGFKHIFTPTDINNFWHQAAQIMYLKARWETHAYQTCFEELEQFRQEDPRLENFPALWILRAVIAQQFQAVDTAFECFAMVDTLKSRAPFALQHFFLETADITWKPLLGMGELALKEGLFLKAANAFKEAAHYLPDHDYVLSGWLQSAFLTRRYSEVTAILERDTALRGISDLARASLEAMHQIKEHGKAESTWDAVALLVEEANVDPFALSVWVELAVLCLQHQKTPLARQFFLHALKYQPEEVMLWHNLAYSYFFEKDYAHAEKYYRQALIVSPHYPNSQFDLAKTLVMQNRQDEAIQLLEDLLTVHPRFHEARKALQELEALKAFDVQMHTPASTASSLTVLSDAPFVFAFPLLPTWESGIDILMKAYYEEFVPTDSVVLAIPIKGEGVPQAVQSARDWAFNTYNEELLPPVALLDESLPLIPDYACWVLPWRLDPGSTVSEALQQQTYPVLMPQPDGALQTFWEIDPESAQAWQTVSVDSLRQAMRTALHEAKNLLEQELETEQVKAPITQMASTHDFLPLATAHPLQPLKKSQNKVPLPTVSTLLESAPTVGVCMIVKNEAAVIERALDTVKHATSEIIVVDTGSTDGTLDKLAQYPGVQVHHFDWCDDFAAARNAAFAKATSDWVLFLDADEYVDPDFIPHLRLQLNHREADAYCFKVVSVQEDGQIDAHTSIGGVPRLFPNRPEYRFEGRIHEMMYNQKREVMQYVYYKGLPIYHVGYRPEIVLEKNKGERDRQLMLAALQEDPDARTSKHLYYILANDYWKMGEQAKAMACLAKGLTVHREDKRVDEQLFYQQQSWRLEMGETATALEALTGRTDNSPRFFLLWSELLIAEQKWLAAYHKLKEALRLAEEARNTPDPLDLQPSQSTLLRLLVDVTQKLQKPEESRHYLARYLKETEDPEPVLWQHYQQLTQQLAPQFST